MAGLLGGGGLADCAPQANPLSQLIKQQNDGRLHQQDSHRQAGPSRAGPSAFRSRPGAEAGQADFNRFMQGEQGPMGGMGMQDMRREIEAMAAERGHQMGAGPAGAGWAAEFANSSGGGSVAEAQIRQALRQAGAEADWSRSFQNFAQEQRSAAMDGRAPVAGPAVSSAYNRMPMYSGMGMSGMGMAGMGMYGPSMYRSQLSSMPAQVSESKGKERIVELNDADWEAQFAKAATSKGEEGKVLSDDLNLAEDQAQDINDPEADAEFLRSLEQTWSNLRETLDASKLSDAELAAYEAEFGTGRFADPEAEDDYQIPDDVDGTPLIDLSKLATEPATYDFVDQAQNPYMDLEDPFARGQELLASGEPLCEAALAFEAACQRDEGRGEAWLALGNTLAMDEKEKRAVRALERAVGCAGPDGKGMADAWLPLAISYVNEGQDLRSLTILEHWISLTYPNIAADIPKIASIGQENRNPWARYEPITQAFIQAARAGPSARSGEAQSTTVDPDVQIGLGVLFYGQADYDRAKDCFEAALSARPNDFLLWNRLGATLANGGKPEEAIHAYKNAIELRPSFTRAYYNLAVSCLNIACFREAAEYLLSCLKMQGKARSDPKGKAKADLFGEEGDDDSGALWYTLRRAFLCMDRNDLAERARTGADVNSFKADGFDF